MDGVADFELVLPRQSKHVTVFISFLEIAPLSLCQSDKSFSDGLNAKISDNNRSSLIYLFMVSV